MSNGVFEEKKKEHERHVRLEHAVKSVVEHAISNKHQINWETTSVFHNTNHFKPRNIKEAMEILKQRGGILIRKMSTQSAKLGQP
jgi:hypothetical protein